MEGGERVGNGIKRGKWKYSKRGEGKKMRHKKRGKWKKERDVREREERVEKVDV